MGKKYSAVMFWPVIMLIICEISANSGLLEAKVTMNYLPPIKDLFLKKEITKDDNLSTF